MPERDEGEEVAEQWAIWIWISAAMITCSPESDSTSWLDATDRAYTWAGFDIYCSPSPNLYSDFTGTGQQSRSVFRFIWPCKLSEPLMNGPELCVSSWTVSALPLYDWLLLTPIYSHRNLFTSKSQSWPRSSWPFFLLHFRSTLNPLLFHHSPVLIVFPEDDSVYTRLFILQTAIVVPFWWWIGVVSTFDDIKVSEPSNPPFAPRTRFSFLKVASRFIL